MPHFPIRLALASVPTAVAALMTLLEVRIFAWPGPYMWHPEFIDLLFGLFVLAPLVPRSDTLALRVLALALASVVFHHMAVGAVFHTQSAFAPGVELRFITMIPIVMAATLAMGLAVQWLASLEFTNANWARLQVSGFVSGLVFFIVWEPMISGLDGEYVMLLPWLLWHLSLAWALGPSGYTATQE